MQYIKMLIMSFISAVFQPLCASSSAHYAFLNKALNFTQDGKEAMFYLSVVSLVFALCSIVILRRIYSKAFKVLFTKKGKSIKNALAYKNMMKGILISLIPALITLIPVSKEKLLLDLMSECLVGTNMLITALCCFVSGFILLIGTWYSKKKNTESDTYKSAKLSDVVKMSLYQIPAFIFPGLSNTALSAVNFELSGLEERSIMRDTLIYTMPSVFTVSIVRIIRTITLGVSIDMIAFAVCVVGALAASILLLNLVKKVNIRRTYTFFSVYSIIFGICIGVISFM